MGTVAGDYCQPARDGRGGDSVQLYLFGVHPGAAKNRCTGLASGIDQTAISPLNPPVARRAPCESAVRPTIWSGWASIVQRISLDDSLKMRSLWSAPAVKTMPLRAIIRSVSSS